MRSKASASSAVTCRQRQVRRPRRGTDHNGSVPKGPGSAYGTCLGLKGVGHAEVPRTNARDCLICCQNSKAQIPRTSPNVPAMILILVMLPLCQKPSDKEGNTSEALGMVSASHLAIGVRILEWRFEVAPAQGL